MSSSRPTPGQVLRTDTDRLVQELRRQLEGAAHEQARERFLKALARKLETSVVVVSRSEGS
jgi:hypothetical protein